MSIQKLTTLWQKNFDRLSPSKIVAIGLNYYDHYNEAKASLPNLVLPKEPSIFGKFANTLCGDGDNIALPPESEHVDAEAELAIVIGQRGRRIRTTNALDYVAGYTVANDVSARDIQFRERNIDRSKGFDSFCPILPVIVPVSKLGRADDQRIIQRVNGKVFQDGNTRDFIFSVVDIVAYVSLSMTLEPGDLILTGTPAGVGIFQKPPRGLTPGDMIEIEIDGIGTLHNPIVTE